MTLKPQVPLPLQTMFTEHNYWRKSHLTLCLLVMLRMRTLELGDGLTTSEWEGRSEMIYRTGTSICHHQPGNSQGILVNTFSPKKCVRLLPL